LTQVCTKSFVGWGFAPDPTGEVTALPRPLSWVCGSLFLREREGKGKDGRDIDVKNVNNIFSNVENVK